MVNELETDEFLSSKKRNSSSSKCYSIWWNQGFTSQRPICRIIESIYFRALVIFLVIADTALIIAEIMLDSYKIHYECKIDEHNHKTMKVFDKNIIKHIELSMEIAHFVSIGILIFFLIELLIRIYAFGREFWNIRRKKMEYFDAFIVITSLIIDLYCLRMKEKIEGEELLIVFTFRLWRFVRIISSVAEGIRHGESKHKEHLNRQYLDAIHRLIHLIKYKTSYLNDNKEDIDSVFEYFQKIDNRCQLSLDILDQNHELTSTLLVSQFIEQINTIENNNNTISQMVIPPSTISI